MTAAEELEVRISSVATGNGFATAGAQAKALSTEVRIADSQWQQLVATHRDRVVRAHDETASSSKRLEEAMRHGSVTLGEQGAAWENLSRKLSGIQGLMGSGIGLGALGLAGAAGLGLGVEAIKSAIENTEAKERADRSLAQAAEVAGRSLNGEREAFERFASTNRSFISNQYEAEQAMALFVRAGNDEQTTTQAMNAALDLASLKHLSLTDAARMVELAMMGNGRAVRELGIDLKTLATSSDVTEADTKRLEQAQKQQTSAAEQLTRAQRTLKEDEDALHQKRTVTKTDLDHLKDKQDAVAKAQTNLAAANSSVAKIQGELNVSQAKSKEILGELSDKVKGGRDDVTPLEQAHNRLNQTWQKTSEKYGPDLVNAVANAMDIVDLGTQIIGKHEQVWDRITGKFGARANTPLGNEGTPKGPLPPGAATAPGVVADQYGKLNQNLDLTSNRIGKTSEAFIGASEHAETLGAKFRSTSDQGARLEAVTNAAQFAAHSHAERLDQQAAAAIAAGEGMRTLNDRLGVGGNTLNHFTDESERAHLALMTHAGASDYLREGTEAVTRAQIGYNREIDSALRKEADLTRGIGENTSEMAPNIDALRMVGRAWDEQRQAMSRSEAEAGFLAAHMQESIYNIREAVAHANQDRLELKVDTSALDALRLQLGQIFNREYNLHFHSEHDDFPPSGGAGGGGSFTPY